MKDFTPRAKELLALALKEAKRLNHAYVGTEHLLLGLIERAACWSPSRRKDGGEHSVHAPSQKGIGISRQRGRGFKAFLRRYRTHFAGTFARRRGDRRTGTKES